MKVTARKRIQAQAVAQAPRRRPLLSPSMKTAIITLLTSTAANILSHLLTR